MNLKVIVLALVALMLSACGGGVIQRVDAVPTPPPGMGFVQIVCDPMDADVFVDGASRGVIKGYAQGVLRLKLGTHRLTLEKAGHAPWHGQVRVGSEPVVVRARLVAEVP